MHSRSCSLQVVANMVRDNLVLGNQGNAARYMVDGRWMTVRQAAEMLGVKRETLCSYMYRHRHPDGGPLSLAEVVEAYRRGQIRYGGRRPLLYKVGSRVMTITEAAKALGVSKNSVYLYMYKHKCGLATAFRYYRQREKRNAEKAIMSILGF